MGRPVLPPPLAGDERFAALCEIVWELYGEVDLEKVLVYLVDLAPDSVLPHLAEQLSMTDELSWPAAVTPDMQRGLIKASIELHRYKGTPWAIKRALGEIGYPVVHIIEHSDYVAQWRGAGGLFLDGSWLLDGSVVLAAPEVLGSDFRLMSLSSWVDYSIRLNTEGPWTLERQEAISRIAAAYAPARSRLRAIITGLAVHIDARVRLVGVSQRGRMRFDKCRRRNAHRWRTLDGCWRLSSEYAPRLLDGSWSLGAGFLLSGQRPAGIALDSPPFGIARSRGVTRAVVQAAGGDRVFDPLPLHSPAKLDGAWHLDGRKLDGSWGLDGSVSLDYPTLRTACARRLDGTWTLGRLPGRPGIWSSAVGVLRRGGVVYRKAL